MKNKHFFIKPCQMLLKFALAPKQALYSALSQRFPDARHVLFLPLYHSFEKLRLFETFKIVTEHTKFDPTALKKIQTMVKSFSGSLFRILQIAPQIPIF